MSKRQRAGTRLGDVHVAESARSGSPLEQGDAEEPDADDGLGRAVDVFLVVYVDVAFVVAHAAGVAALSIALAVLAPAKVTPAANPKCDAGFDRQP